jgi:hypothetical protein
MVLVTDAYAIVIASVQCSLIHTASPLHALQKKYNGWRIYYYAAVNALTGAVYIKLMSGSYPYKTEWVVGSKHCIFNAVR